MKLFTKYNRLNIATSIITFIIGSCSFYFLLCYILQVELDESLKAEQQEISGYVRTHNQLPEIVPTNEEITTYALSDRIIETKFLKVTKTVKNSTEEWRELQFGIHANGVNYLVTVDKPMAESEDLLQLIIVITIAMIALILLINYFANRLLIKKLWNPFYQTIHKIKNYQITDGNSLSLKSENIDEFELLNQTITGLVDRLQKDYLVLKNFTGKAAHEMQTPLAVISLRLDALMQNEAILKQNAENITDIEKSVRKLSKLHQSLLLLTKVENKQFQLNEEVLLDTIIQEKCKELADLTDVMQLNIKLDIMPVKLLFHKHLAEIVVGNLLNNAIRYNIENGQLIIELTKTELLISNTSINPALDENNIFVRFYRHTNNMDGNGLGLSIVKEITEFAGFSISYYYAENKHTFKVVF